MEARRARNGNDAHGLWRRKRSEPRRRAGQVSDTILDEDRPQDRAEWVLENTPNAEISCGLAILLTFGLSWPGLAAGFPCWEVGIPPLADAEWRSPPVSQRKWVLGRAAVLALLPMTAGEQRVESGGSTGRVERWERGRRWASVGARAGFRNPTRSGCRRSCGPQRRQASQTRTGWEAHLHGSLARIDCPGRMQPRHRVFL